MKPPRPEHALDGPRPRPGRLQHSAPIDPAVRLRLLLGFLNQLLSRPDESLDADPDSDGRLPAVHHAPADGQHAAPSHAHHLESNQPLPQLELVSDAARMRRVWESAMPQYRIEDCVVVHTRYRPREHNCLVCYRLTIRQAERAGTQLLYGRFYFPGDSLPYFLEAQQAPLAAPRFGQPLYHLPELEGVVWAFPNDRLVRGIPALLDRQRVASDVVPLLVRAGGAEGAIGEISLELVRYRPERGCTVRVTVPLAGGSRPVFYGKAYKGSRGEETYRNMRALWQAPQRPASLGMAKPLDYDAEHRILWQSAVEGATLAEFEKTPGPTRLLQFEAAGGAVAALHSTPAPGLKPRTLADVWARLKAAAQRLADAQPPLARRVSSFTARLLAEAGRLDTRPSATLHGDLHADNVVFTGSGVALIDLDKLRAGDPLEDLGSFLGSTCRRGLEHEVSVADLAQMVGAALRGYERGAPCEVPRRALRWYTAVALLSEQANCRMKRMKSGSLEALLDAAESALNGSGLWGSVL